MSNSTSYSGAVEIPWDFGSKKEKNHYKLEPSFQVGVTPKAYEWKTGEHGANMIFQVLSYVEKKHQVSVKLLCFRAFFLCFAPLFLVENFWSHVFFGRSRPVFGRSRCVFGFCVMFLVVLPFWHQKNDKNLTKTQKTHVPECKICINNHQAMEKLLPRLNNCKQQYLHSKQSEQSRSLFHFPRLAVYICQSRNTRTHA